MVFEPLIEALKDKIGLFARELLKLSGKSVILGQLSR
jgi:hypothetical protein